MTEKELRKILGQNIKKRRVHKDWTQELLAEKIDVSKNTISEIETGQKFARPKTLVCLAGIFETDVYELFKPENVFPDKVTDVFIKYNEKIKEVLDEMGSTYLENMATSKNGG